MKKEDYVRMCMVDAMKARDKETKDTLSLLLSALKNAEIDKKRELTTDEENAAVYKEIRQTQETLDMSPKDRMDIIDQCKRRMEILKKFAPKYMDEIEIKSVIEDTLLSLGFAPDSPATKKSKGIIMKELMPKVKGKADGKLVNSILDGMLV